MKLNRYLVPKFGQIGSLNKILFKFTRLTRGSSSSSGLPAPLCTKTVRHAVVLPSGSNSARRGLQRAHRKWQQPCQARLARCPIAWRKPGRADAV